MSDFDTFLNTVKAGIPALARELGQQYLETALQDANDFLASQQEDLERRTAKLATGELTQDDFEYFVKAKAELAQMALLTQAGLAQVQIDRFVNGVINLIIDTAFKVFL